jgi:hypothetical protein
MKTHQQLPATVCVALALACLTLPIGCKREDPQVAIAAQAAASEQAASQAAAAFDSAVAEENWHLAKAQADVLLATWPGTPSAQRVRKQFDEVAAKAEAQREQRRTAALWSYNSEPVKGGTQLSAAMYAQEEVDVDGSGDTPVRLIFRDHPAWGRSAYLVLQAGDFRCPGGCKVRVTVDDGATKAMAATRPDTDEAIAMFIEDERALWRLTRDAKQVSIEFPTRDVGKRSAVFEVAGLDRSKLPGWD